MHGISYDSGVDLTFYLCSRRDERIREINNIKQERVEILGNKSWRNAKIVPMTLLNENMKKIREKELALKIAEYQLRFAIELTKSLA